MYSRVCICVCQGRLGTCGLLRCWVWSLCTTVPRQDSKTAAHRGTCMVTCVQTPPCALAYCPQVPMSGEWHAGQHRPAACALCVCLLRLSGCLCTSLDRPVLLGTYVYLFIWIRVCVHAQLGQGRCPSARGSAWQGQGCPACGCVAASTRSNLFPECSFVQLPSQVGLISSPRSFASPGCLLLKEWLCPSDNS